MNKCIQYNKQFTKYLDNTSVFIPIINNAFYFEHNLKPLQLKCLKCHFIQLKLIKMEKRREENIFSLAHPYTLTELNLLQKGTFSRHLCI